MVYKKAFSIVLAKANTSNQATFYKLNQERLEVRRMNLSVKFAVKCTRGEVSLKRHVSIWDKFKIGLGTSDTSEIFEFQNFL